MFTSHVSRLVIAFYMFHNSIKYKQGFREWEIIGTINGARDAAYDRLQLQALF